MTDTRPTLWAKLQTARAELSQTTLKKSGYNPYAKYYYFQLDDFLPTINTLFDKLKLLSKFDITPPKKHITADGVVVDTEPEMATLEIIDSETGQKEIFRMPTAEAPIKGSTPIQALGSKDTYMRRYLWLNAMEITENDMTEGAKIKEAEKQQGADNTGDNQDKSIANAEIIVAVNKVRNELYKKGCDVRNDEKFLQELAKNKLGTSDPARLSQAQAEHLLKFLNQYKAENYAS